MFMTEISWDWKQIKVLFLFLKSSPHIIKKFMMLANSVHLQTKDLKAVRNFPL